MFHYGLSFCNFLQLNPIKILWVICVKKVVFIKNAALLTGTALVLRCVGIFFRVWLAGAVGAEGMGLYQVIYSVYVFASTFATSGICTAVTRMVTSRLRLRDKKGAGRVVKIAIVLSLIIAFISSGLIIGFAEPIAKYLIADKRAAVSLKILSLGLPFLGVCSVIRGYFLARRSALPSSVGQIIEQISRMGIIVFLVGRYSSLGLAATTAAVILGDTLAEIIGTLVIYIFYRVDFRSIKNMALERLSKRRILRELMRISLPISSGRYLHTGLRTAENLITPTCLKAYAGSKSDALSQFGMVKAMALPLLLFPASLLSAISTLLVPEMTEAMERGNAIAIKSAVNRVFYLTSVISFFIAGFFFTAATGVGNIVYSSPEVGFLIKALSPLVPFMYIDLIADGILKGLDKQKSLFKINVSDSVIRIILVVLLVPRFGMLGFLGVMIFSNTYTGSLAVIKIVKTTGVKFDTSLYFLKPLFAALLSFGIVDILCRPIKYSLVLHTAITFMGGLILYVILLAVLGVVDLSAIKSKRKEKKV